MLKIVLFVNLITLISASCPFLLKTRQQAEIQRNLELELKHNLVDNGFLVSDGQPGSAFWIADSLSHVELLNKSELLYQTEQLYSYLYLEKNGGPEIYTTKEKLKNLSSLSNCLPLEDRCRVLNQTINPEDYKYRTINGTFNNLDKPLYGASFTGFERFIDPVYDDGIETIRRNFVNDAELPVPRIIGNAIFQNIGNRIYPKNILNTMGLYFAQTGGAHDITRIMKNAPLNGGQIMSCCTKDYTKMLPRKFLTDACLPMHMPKNDPFFSKYNMTCQTFVRTFKAMNTDCKLGSSTQMNRQTSYLDNSILYGITIDRMNQLRAYSGGKMKTNKENVLPRDPTSDEYTYIFGDARNQQTPVTILISSILNRLHNNIANELAQLNPHWNDEILFQEARRINTALYQHMYYTEFLPIILDEKYLLEKNIICKNQTYCGVYNSTVNPNANAEYSESVFRTFHSMVPDLVQLYNSDFKNYQCYQISDVINNITLMQTDYLGVLRGGLMQPVKLEGYNQQMRTTVFKNDNDLGVGIDVSSIDIQRGRDHGLAPYYKYMEYCQPHLGKISCWDDLKPNILEKDINTLKSIYNSVWDVDLLIGIYLERQSNYFGPVGKCIIGEQYYRTKFGDRFFYSFKDGDYPFVEDQMKEILNYSFAQMLCQQADLEKVPKNALVIPSDSNPFINCSKFRQFNFSLWKEENLSKTSKYLSTSSDSSYSSSESLPV